MIRPHTSGPAGTTTGGRGHRHPAAHHNGTQPTEHTAAAASNGKHTCRQLSHTPVPVMAGSGEQDVALVGRWERLSPTCVPTRRGGWVRRLWPGAAGRGPALAERHTRACGRPEGCTARERASRIAFSAPRRACCCRAPQCCYVADGDGDGGCCGSRVGPCAQGARVRGGLWAPLVPRVLERRDGDRRTGPGCPSHCAPICMAAPHGDAFAPSRCPRAPCTWDPPLPCIPGQATPRAGRPGRQRARASWTSDANQTDVLTWCPSTPSPVARAHSLHGRGAPTPKESNTEASVRRRCVRGVGRRSGGKKGCKH